MKTYKQLATLFYDHAKPLDDARAEIAFYTAYAMKAQGPILEPMCGSGRIFIPLAQAGCAIEGFDASAQMLAVLQATYAQLFGKPAPVWQEYAQDFNNGKKYTLIIIPFGSLGLIVDPHQRLRALKALYTHLAPGGVLVMEIDTVASESEAEPVWREQSFTNADGSIIAVQMRSLFDAASQMYYAQSVYTLVIAGSVVATEQELFEQYVFRFDELDAELAAVGFTVIKKYSNYAGTLAVDDTVPQVIYECRRDA